MSSRSCRHARAQMRSAGQQKPEPSEPALEPFAIQTERVDFVARSLASFATAVAAARLAELWHERKGS